MTPRLLVLAGLLACSGADTLAPVGATRVDLGPRWTEVWSAVEACSGLSGRSEAVTVYSVPGDFILLDGQRVIAYWSPANAIYVASFYLTSDPVLRHEVLHALLRSGDHPAEYFGARCGHLVGGP